MLPTYAVVQIHTITAHARKKFSLFASLQSLWPLFSLHLGLGRQQEDLGASRKGLGVEGEADKQGEQATSASNCCSPLLGTRNAVDFLFFYFIKTTSPGSDVYNIEV